MQQENEDKHAKALAIATGAQVDEDGEEKKKGKKRVDQEQQKIRDKMDKKKLRDDLIEKQENTISTLDHFTK